MNKLRVLIADDHNLFREGMESLLLKTNIVESVFHACSGNEALNIIASQPIDLVFMDIRMEEGNGIITTQHIRQTDYTIKIIALTMMEDTFSVVNMFKAGANGYLLKNTSYKEVIEAIDVVMKGDRYFSKALPHFSVDKLQQTINPVNRANRPKLTSREKEIIGFICQGFTNKDIADLLFISIKTVETHRSRIYAKLNVSSGAELAFYYLYDDKKRNTRGSL